MFSLQQKIMKSAKKQENITYTMGGVGGMGRQQKLLGKQITDLTEKDFKLDIKKCLQTKEKHKEETHIHII